MSETQETQNNSATHDNDQESKVETFSREYVEGLRNEAARYRTEKKDAVEQAKTETRAAVIKEYEPQLAERDTKITQLESDLSARDLELLKIKAVLKAEIPSEDVLDVVSLVQGTDEESVSDSVQRVKTLIGKAPKGQSPVDYSQGQGGGVPPLNGDKVLNILKAAVKAK